MTETKIQTILTSDLKIVYKVNDYFFKTKDNAEKYLIKIKKEELKDNGI